MHGGAAHGAALRVSVEGLEQELQDAAFASLSINQYVERDVTAAQVRRLYARGEDEIREALEPYGYYDARVEGRLENEPDAFHAIYEVDPGQPVIVREQSVRVEGEGADAEPVQEAVAAAEPKEGERLDHAAYEQTKAEIEGALLSIGYLDAKATVKRVEVVSAAHAASIDLEYESGPRFRFGDVRFSESQFPAEFLDRFIPWEDEEYYSTAQLLAFQQRLVDADYFATVAVQPNPEDGEGTSVPVDVLLTPAKPSVYSGAVYVSTDTGPGIRVGLERRWMNRRGHKLDTQLEYSQRLQEASVAYQIPLRGRNERRLNLGTGYREETTDTSESRMARFAANESVEWRGFTRTLGFQFLNGDFEIGSEQRSTTLLYPEGVLMRRRADNLSFTRDGYSLTLGLRGAPFDVATDTRFGQITADYKRIVSVGERQRLILRTSLGAMTVDDFDLLPPELRFFAGGDRSVRGFDYESLGTTNAAGEVIGGKYLAVASTEFEHYFLENWGAALFVDAGDAFHSTAFQENVGAGIGVRWKSPVGTLRVDVAKPIVSDLADEFRIHITIGPDL